MMLAAGMLEHEVLMQELSARVRQIDFGFLIRPPGSREPDTGRDTSGFVGHGLDARFERAPGTWLDWGGETALVLLLKRLAGNEAPDRLSTTGDHEGASGRVYEGRGFIAEIQSLFWPDFDRFDPDAFAVAQGGDRRASWGHIRASLREEQRECTRHHFPGSAAAALGIFGYSSGEDPDDLKDGYHENGCRAGRPMPKPVLFPHYMLMSSTLAADADAAVRELEQLETRGLFPPWGLPESFDVELRRPLALASALNAAFESISAFHLLSRVRRQDDPIYRASQQSPPMRHALEIFYSAAASLPDSAAPAAPLR